MLALLHGKVDRLNQLILSETKPAIKLQSLPFLFLVFFNFFVWSVVFWFWWAKTKYVILWFTFRMEVLIRIWRIWLLTHYIPLVDHVVSLLTMNFWKLISPFAVVQNQFCKFSCIKGRWDILLHHSQLAIVFLLYSHDIHSFYMQKNCI